MPSALYPMVAGLVISFLALCASRNRSQGWTRQRSTDLLQFSESLRELKASHAFTVPSQQPAASAPAAPPAPADAARGLSALHSAIGLSAELTTTQDESVRAEQPDVHTAHR